jgi:hypothetical protein
MYLIPFVICCLTIIVLPSQTVKPPTKQKFQINDSLPIISRMDIVNFNEYLKKVASYDQYIKLSPEATLLTLLNWKTDQLKQQLTDTSKPKK